MIISQITSKGQTTIPSIVRKALGLHPHDRLEYEIEKDRVIIHALKGTILDHKGTVKPKRKPENFKEIRKQVRTAVAKSIVQRG